jgi:AraC-like DNA-binding protein/CheY-like chemotaxis protein
MQVSASPQQPIQSLYPERALQDAHNTVLVAGQSTYNCSRLSESLKVFYNVVVVGLNEAHTLALQHLPDILVIDMTVNCANALQLCYQLKLNENINHIPVILVGDEADTHTKLAGLQFGADDFVVGAESCEEFIWRIRNHIQLCKNLKKKLAKEAVNRSSTISPTSDSYLLLRMMKAVEDNIANNVFSVSLFSRELGLSQVQLYRKVLFLTGLSPNEYIRKMRLQRAADLLRLQSGNISEVAFKVGFTNRSYFSKCFREAYACSPSDFVKRKHVNHLSVEKSGNFFAS